MTSVNVREVHPQGGVVVGDDGSTCADIAVRLAALEAARRGIDLHVIRAWSFATSIRPSDVPAGIVPSMVELESATLAEEQSRVARLLGDLSGVTVHVHVVHSEPAPALLTAADSADLLVVGSRGLGGFKRLLLGSIAEQCVRHAPCSVLVAREK